MLLDEVIILSKSGEVYQAINVQGETVAYSTNRQEVLSTAIERGHIIFVDSTFQKKEVVE